MKLRVRFRRDRRGLSPVISSVIITGTIVALLTVVVIFANNFLWARIAESDFDAAKQFMQTVGLQIDDVAWVIGRTETARFSSRYGNVVLKPALNYTIYINTTMQSNVKLYTNITNIICFNMPISQYTLGNGYFELIYPSASNGFLLSGASVPVAKIFAVEKVPMNDGSFVRVVAVPIIRMINLTIGDTNYVRLYLPVLLEGETIGRSQSVTLTGESISNFIIGGEEESVTAIKIEANFPLAGFDSSFFNFSQTLELIQASEETILELYIGAVDVGLGVHL